MQYNDKIHVMGVIFSGQIELFTLKSMHCIMLVFKKMCVVWYYLD